MHVVYRRKYAFFMPNFMRITTTPNRLFPVQLKTKLRKEWISADIRDTLTIQRPATPKCVDASDSIINDDGVSTLKQACSG